jgi:nicotinamidase-related amidase
MSTSVQRPTIDQLLSFYTDRGYSSRVGPGKRPALIVIDFSLAFTGGKSDFPGGRFDNEVMQALRLADAFREAALPVLFTTIAYEDPVKESGWWGVKVPWLHHCKMDSPLVNIDSRLQRRDDEPVIVKRFPSSFFHTDLDDRLKQQGCDTLVIAGCTTSVCVRATALDAMQHGYRAILAAEAIGEFDPGIHELNLKDLDSRYADAVGVTDLIRYVGSIAAANES